MAEPVDLNKIKKKEFILVNFNMEVDKKEIVNNLCKKEGIDMAEYFRLIIDEDLKARGLIDE